VEELVVLGEAHLEQIGGGVLACHASFENDPQAELPSEVVVLVGHDPGRGEEQPHDRE
jgi:hypothetical protein